MGADGPVNRWQEVLYDLCFVRELVHAKHLSYRMGKAHNYISDVCRRDRVDALYIFNLILQDARSLAVDQPAKLTAIAMPIINLLLENTGWTAYFVHPDIAAPARAVSVEDLHNATAVMLENVAELVRSLGGILKDGVVNESDQARVAEFDVKVGGLFQHLNALTTELHKRVVEAAAHGP